MSFGGNRAQAILDLMVGSTVEQAKVVVDVRVLVSVVLLTRDCCFALPIVGVDCLYHSAYSHEIVRLSKICDSGLDMTRKSMIEMMA